MAEPTPTVAMRCPHCKKTTQCKHLNAPKGNRVMYGGRRFLCTECQMGFNVALGGIPTHRPYNQG